MTKDETQPTSRHPNPFAARSPALSRALSLADEIDQFPLEECALDADPEKQWAYVYAFRDIAKRFIAAAKRIGDPDLSEMVAGLDDASLYYITDASDLRASLWCAVDYLRDAAENPAYESGVVNNAAFLDPAIIAQLKSAKFDLDLSKLVRFCEELNDTYRRGNYLACVLLIRAVMNHVPPIFGAHTFAQVVASSGKSVKAILTRLGDEARPIGDLHTHFLIRIREPLPTKHQVEPYKASFEILIQEILARTE
jgi:hypothetical protein